MLACVSTLTTSMCVLAWINAHTTFICVLAWVHTHTHFLYICVLSWACVLACINAHNIYMCACLYKHSQPLYVCLLWQTHTQQLYMCACLSQTQTTFIFVRAWINKHNLYICGCLGKHIHIILSFLIFWSWIVIKSTYYNNFVAILNSGGFKTYILK